MPSTVHRINNMPGVLWKPDCNRRRVIGLAALIGLMPSLLTRGATVPKELQFGGRAELCSSANAVGIGLQGEYFSKASPETPFLTRTDGVIDFDAALGWSGVTNGPKPASARWRGWVRPLTTGRYMFHATAPGMRVTLAREVVASFDRSTAIDVEMTAGRYYPISVELESLSLPAGQRVRLEWTAPQGARYLIPRALLYLPTETIQTRSS